MLTFRSLCRRRAFYSARSFKQPLLRSSSSCNSSLFGTSTNITASVLCRTSSRDSFSIDSTSSSIRISRSFNLANVSTTIAISYFRDPSTSDRSFCFSSTDTESRLRSFELQLGANSRPFRFNFEFRRFSSSRPDSFPCSRSTSSLYRSSYDVTFRSPSFPWSSSSIECFTSSSLATFSRSRNFISPLSCSLPISTSTSISVSTDVRFTERFRPTTFSLSSSSRFPTSAFATTFPLPSSSSSTLSFSLPRSPPSATAISLPSSRRFDFCWNSYPLNFSTSTLTFPFRSFTRTRARSRSRDETFLTTSSSPNRSHDERTTKARDQPRSKPETKQERRTFPETCRSHRASHSRLLQDHHLPDGSRYG